MDVAIVGGGITGAALAWRFADAGLRVALVEAARIGRGSTAASTALLMQEPDADLTELAQRYGWRRARRIWQLSLAATNDFVDTLTRLRINATSCATTRCTTRPIGKRSRACATSIDEGWRPDPRQLFALGHGGNGMTFGFLASRLLLDWYRGNRSKDHALFAFSR